MVLAHRTMLKAFIRALVRDPVLAEDTFSDLILIILNSWDRYDSARPFTFWARGVARRVALANLRKEYRQPCLLDEDVLDAVAQEIDKFGGEPQLDMRQEALQSCVQRLKPDHQRLIRFRYFDDRSYNEISALVGKTVGTLYVVFNRLHKMLSLCIERELRRM